MRGTFFATILIIVLPLSGCLGNLSYISDAETSDTCSIV